MLSFIAIIISIVGVLNYNGILPPKAMPNIQAEYSIKYNNETALYRITLKNIGSTEATNLKIKVSFPKNIIITDYTKSDEPEITGGGSCLNITYLEFLNGDTTPITIIFKLDNTSFIDGKSWNIDTKPFIWTNENKQITDVKLVDW